MITYAIGICLLILFGLVVFRGAPYIPTHRQSITAALDLMHLAPGDTVVDLGSGDGAFLRQAAKRGLHAVGYEINPLLCAVAWWRCLAWRQRVTIKLRDYWLTDLPDDTKAVFVFLAGPHMRHLQRKLVHEMQRRTQPLVVVSHGFAIPGLLPTQIKNGLYVYTLQPQK